MKVETPQILWHSEKKNWNAALLSIVYLDTNVFCTAGHSNTIHLWNNTSNFVCELSRYDAPVNRLKLSPDKTTLAAAGDTGVVMLWTCEDWKTLTKENELKVSIAFRNGAPITDLSWSPDSKKLLISTIDHTVKIVQNSNMLFQSNAHSHYVQGVAWDPKNYYIASASSDRSIRVFKSKNTKKALKFETKSVVKYHTTSTTLQEENNNTKKYWFCDESTLSSYCRRLAWTPDGSYLIVPAAQVEDSYATLLFARHAFDAPAILLGGLEKPSICVVPNPVLFQLPEDGKENATSLPYRCLFAVLTWDSVIVYDTYHTTPLSAITGIHYSQLVDGSWSNDGHTLSVCSTDGYVTFISFEQGELGTVYAMTPLMNDVKHDEAEVVSSSTTKLQEEEASAPVKPSSKQVSPLPPCEPGAVAVQCPPAKKAKVIDDVESSKRQLDDLVLDESKTKKKRIQPTLLSMN